MKILHLSDTHNCHRRMTGLPEADIIVHSGDFTMAGSEQEAIDFMEWFSGLPYDHKIFIGGNHDDCLYGATVDGLDDNCHYLCNSGIEIEGIKFYGVPMFMDDYMNDRQLQYIAEIPEEVDVLITHAPPFGILDMDSGLNYGSRELLQRISKVNPRLHLFGHIHKSHGVIDNGITIFSNGAIMDESYSSLQSPAIFHLNSSPERRGGKGCSR